MPLVLAEIRQIRDAATLDAARAQADRVLNKYRGEFPSAMACLEDDLDALINIHRIPVRHRQNVRTTNLAERSFEEERRRTKIIPRLMGERAALKLVYATLIRCADRWARIAVSDLERRQLAQLRIELGIDQPPKTKDEQPKRTGDTEAA